MLELKRQIHDKFKKEPKNVNKGYFISHILQNNIANNNYPDFIMAIGDDT